MNKCCARCDLNKGKRIFNCEIAEIAYVNAVEVGETADDFLERFYCSEFKRAEP